MKIATWNINGIRARHDRLVEWLRTRSPDAVCLQETKIEDRMFPAPLFEQLGYHVVYHGQKAYNGVAIASKEVPQDTVRGMGIPQFDQDARLISTRLGGIRITCAYVPNGKEVGCDKYDHKLAWMKGVREWLSREVSQEPSWLLCGDFNVTPTDLDVHDPVAWHGHILCSEPEREALAQIRLVGFHDAFRSLYPQEPGFTWWDYRQLGFPKNRGLRIDLALVSPALLAKLERVEVDRDERKGAQPSDHAPLVLTLRDG